MAASCESSRPTFRLRSVSLPSKSHPLVTIVDEQLCRLGVSATTPSSSGCKLGGLKDLYESVDDMLQLPMARGAIWDKDIDAMLDGSLRLLDICGTTRYVFSQMKKSVQELESSIRRKRGDKSSIGNEVTAYMVSRRRLYKAISKSLGNSKSTKKSCRTETGLTDMLRHVEETTLAIFECLLSTVSSKTKSRPTGWSLVSKIVKPRQVSREEQTHANEIEQMDVELLSLVGKKSSPVKVRNALKGLEALESNIQETEQELECVYRRLLKARSSMLNLLHNQ